MFDPLAKDKQQPDSSTANISRQLYPSSPADGGQIIFHSNCRVIKSSNSIQPYIWVLLKVLLNIQNYTWSKT